MEHAEVYLKPKFVEQLKNGEAELALQEAREATEKMTMEDPYERAIAAREAWFQVALIYDHLNSYSEAADAVLESINQNYYDYEKYPLLMEILFKGEKKIYDEAASWLSFLHQTKLFSTHADAFGDIDIRQLVEENEHRSKKLYWRKEDYLYADDIILVIDRKSSSERVINRIKKWRTEGRSALECDILETNFYFHTGNGSQLLKLWKGKDISAIPYPRTFARIWLARIETGEEIVDDLPLPASDAVDDWILSVRDLSMILSTYRLVEENESFRTSQVNKLMHILTKPTDRLIKLFECGHKNASISKLIVEKYREIKQNNNIL